MYFEKNDSSRLRLVFNAVLRSVSELARTVARAYAMSAFMITVVGFIYYPRPHCSHWSAHKRAAYEVIQFGGEQASIAFILCCLAGGLALYSTTRKRRPLATAFALVVAAMLMVILTPPY